jgi:HAD superfamily hydrolase (TIGR01509 family)
MISNKLLIFDMDGVIISSRDTHYTTLNEALVKYDPSGKYFINREDHLSTFDGLPTSRKLAMLTEKRGLPVEAHQEIWTWKQDATIRAFNNLKPDFTLVEMFAGLKKDGYKIAVCSNSIRNTVKIILLRLGLVEFVDYVVSNEDVEHNKPNPEMYWKAMLALNALPSTTLILEDSHIGRQGALDSGAYLMPIEDAGTFSLADVRDFAAQTILADISSPRLNRIPWKDSKLNVVIPMAGLGSRFSAAGYTFPKPLIEVRGKPMIQVVVENLNMDANYIFIVQQEHLEKYNLNYMLPLITPNKKAKIVTINGLTEGAACTVLKAKEFIDNDDPIVIANSDQFVEWNSNEAMYAFRAEGINAGIVVFNSTHPKWSYAKLNDSGFVAEVAEKKPISDLATVGIYYWQCGKYFVKYAEQMIAANDRVNTEFYVAPVFNYAVRDGAKIRVKHAEKMWGIGTPEDLNYFNEHYKGTV